MNSAWICLAALVLAACATAAEPTFHLGAGTPIRIEYYEATKPEVVRFAVDELQRYAGRMLDRKLEWQRVPVVSVDGGFRILLRNAQARAPKDSAAVAPDAHVDEFAIETTPGAVTLTASNPASLLSAVYALLETQGCHWLYPGPQGEVIPTKNELAFPLGRKYTRADLEMRGLFPVENLQRYTAQDVRDTLDWMAKNRLNHLVLIYNYGWQRLGEVVLREARKRDIRLVGYIWSFELFLPLDAGKQHPEYFALIDGKRRVENNVKRCASSPGAIELYLRNALAFFHAHPEIETWNVIPNDGYHWCECDRCRQMKPKDQWAAFFAPLVEEVRRSKLPVRLQNFIYVTRFDLPRNIAAYRGPRLDHFFDVHQRDKWYSLREPGGRVGHRLESAVDDRARTMTLNNYLADRLKAWRAAVGGVVDPGFQTRQ